MKEKLKALQKWVFNLPIIRNILAWIKVNSLPGFFGVPIYDILVFLKNEIRGGVIATRSQAIAFNFFLSLFPGLIAVITLFPLLEKSFLKYLPSGENFESLLTKFQVQFKDIVPMGVFETVSDVALNPRFGLLSLGFILAIFFASNGMLSIMASFEKSYVHTFRRRNIFRKRLIAILLTFLMVSLMVISVIMVILGEMILQSIITKFNLSQFDGLLFNIARWVIVIASFYFIITSIFRYGAATHRRFAVFSAGTTLTTILSLLSCVFFSSFVNNFDTYNKLYGSLGTIIVTMLWIQINAFVLLVGFELNASIAVNRDLKQAKVEEVE